MMHQTVAVDPSIARENPSVILAELISSVRFEDLTQSVVARTEDDFQEVDRIISGVWNLSDASDMSELYLTTL
jgi:hypothetical protein